MTNPDRILEHARTPYHRGRFAGATHAHTARHTTCGDQICLQLKIYDDGVVTAAWHEGHGCLISLAAASILCEYLKGKSASAVAALRPKELLHLVSGADPGAHAPRLAVPLTPGRVGCALVAFDALKAILRQWANSEPRCL